MQHKRRRDTFPLILSPDQDKTHIFRKLKLMTYRQMDRRILFDQKK